MTRIVLAIADDLAMRPNLALDWTSWHANSPSRESAWPAGWLERQAPHTSEDP
jgi:hypothetical protein